MSILDQENKVRFTGDSVTVDFDFNFKIFAVQDLDVYLIDTSVTPNISVLLTLTTDYSVQFNPTGEGGTLTMVVAPIATDDLLIARVLDYTQPTEIPTESNIPEKSLENAYDKGVMLAQQNKEELTRTAKLPITTTTTDVIIPEPDDGKALIWDGITGTLKNSEDEIDGIITAATAAQVAAENAQAAAETAQTGSELAETNAETAEANAVIAQVAAEAAQAAAEAAGGSIGAFVDDAAFLADKGSAAENKDWYYNTTIHEVKLYANGIWTILENAKNNLVATVDPATTDDSASNYEVGSKWVNVTDDLIFFCIDATASAAIWQEVGSGSGGGGLSVFGTEDHERDGIDLYTKGNNATIGLGVDGEDGALSLEISAPISGTQSMAYIQGASSVNDWILSKPFTLEEKQQDNYIGCTFYLNNSAGFLDDDMRFFLWDTANSEVIQGTSTLIKAGSSSGKKIIQTFVASLKSMTTVKLGYQVLSSTSGAKIIADDIQFETDPLVFATLVSENTFSAKIIDLSTTPVVGSFDTDFIDNISRTSQGIYVVTYKTNFFSVEPTVVGLHVDGNANDDAFISATASSATSITIVCTSSSSGEFDPDKFSIVVRNQLADYIAPQESIISNATPGANWTNTGVMSIGATTTPPTKASNLERDRILYIRNANLAKLRYEYRSDTTTVGSATGSGDYLYSLPIVNGIQLEFDSSLIDFFTANVGTSSPADILHRSLGVVMGQADGIATMNTAGVIPYDSTQFRVCYLDTSNNFRFFGSGIAFARTTQINNGHVFMFEVPILGWDLENSVRSVISPLIKTIIIKDAKASGTAGGTFTGGSWQTHVLTTMDNGQGFVSFDAGLDRFTVNAKNYTIRASMVAKRVNGFQCKIANITDSVDEGEPGNTVYSGSGESTYATSHVAVDSSHSEPKTFELQGWAENTKATDGFGDALSTGSSEVYATIEIDIKG